MPARRQHRRRVAIPSLAARRGIRHYRRQRQHATRCYRHQRRRSSSTLNNEAEVWRHTFRQPHQNKRQVRRQGEGTRVAGRGKVYGSSRGQRLRRAGSILRPPSSRRTEGSGRHSMQRAGNVAALALARPAPQSRFQQKVEEDKGYRRRAKRNSTAKHRPSSSRRAARWWAHRKLPEIHCPTATQAALMARTIHMRGTGGVEPVCGSRVESPFTNVQRSAPLVKYQAARACQVLFFDSVPWYRFATQQNRKVRRRGKRSHFVNRNGMAPTKANPSREQERRAASQQKTPEADRQRAGTGRRVPATCSPRVHGR